MYQKQTHWGKDHGHTPIYNSAKEIKYLGLNLVKDVKDLYNKNLNFLKKEIQKDTRKWKDTLCLWIGRINIVKMIIL